MNLTRIIPLAILILSMQAAPPAKQKALTTHDAQIKELVAKMTLEEKIGQMTQPDQEALKDVADIEKLFLGSVLSGGSSDPKEGNSLKAWTDMYNRYQAALAEDATGHSDSVWR